MTDPVSVNRTIRIEYWNLGEIFLCHAETEKGKVNSVGKTLDEAFTKLLEQVEA